MNLNGKKSGHKHTLRPKIKQFHILSSYMIIKILSVNNTTLLIVLHVQQIANISN